MISRDANIAKVVSASENQQKSDNGLTTFLSVVNVDSHPMYKNDVVSKALFPIQPSVYFTTSRRTGKPICVVHIRPSMVSVINSWMPELRDSMSNEKVGDPVVTMCHARYSCQFVSQHGVVEMVLYQACS